MAWGKRTQPSSRTWGGVTVTGDAGRYRRHKTNGARAAGRAAEEWEQQDRARGGWSLTNWRR